MTGVGALAIGVALALVILTSALNQASVKLGGATERLRLLMELESYALQHVRQTADSESQTAIGIIDRLREASEPEFREDIQRLDAMIESVAAASTQAERASAFDTVVSELRSVASREDQDARRAMAVAASWNRLANITGIVAVLVMLAGVAGVLAWLWRSALQPLVAVIEAIERVAKGDAGARVAEEGPSEIRQIAVAFNGMAASLGRATRAAARVHRRRCARLTKPGPRASDGCRASGPAALRPCASPRPRSTSGRTIGAHDR